MIRGRWFITPHAVRRYIERVHPELTYDEALLVLTKLSELARRVKEIEPGIALWRGPRPERLRCIVAENADGGRLPQLLTLYQGHDYEWRELRGECRNEKPQIR